MKFGVVLQLTDETPSVLKVAPAIEERGFESMFFGEHTHLPVTYPLRVTQGMEFPMAEFYSRMCDPLVSMSMAAAVTSGVKIGTAIALATEHNPIIWAKQLATLDYLTGGRLVLGIGYGWSSVEMRNNGIDFEHRKEILTEKMRAIEEIWCRDEPAFAGEFVTFDPLYSWPKPTQRPRPPVLLGAAAVPRTWRDIAQWADGWMPTSIRAEGQALGAHIGTMRRYAEEAGRDPSAMQVSLIHLSVAKAQGNKESLADFVAGLPTRDLVELYEGFGVDRIILAPPTEDLTQTLRALDAVHPLITGGPGDGRVDL